MRRQGQRPQPSRRVLSSVGIYDAMCGNARVAPHGRGGHLTKQRGVARASPCAQRGSE
jgi:hypothetical protein